MEAKLAITAILQRCPNLALRSMPLNWSNSLVLRGVQSLPVSFIKQASTEGSASLEQGMAG
jgi:cytochrome P450